MGGNLFSYLIRSYKLKTLRFYLVFFHSVIKQILMIMGFNVYYIERRTQINIRMRGLENCGVQEIYYYLPNTDFQNYHRQLCMHGHVIAEKSYNIRAKLTH